MAKLPENNSTEQLIELVREREVLYNVRHPEYKDLGQTRNIWESIGGILGMTDLIITEVDSFQQAEQVPIGQASSSEDEDEIPPKVPRLLARYNLHRNKSGSTMPEDTTRRQLVKYLDDIESACPADALVYWQDMGRKLPTLHKLSHKVLSVPASSAPVERIFSRGGIIMRPHRARLSADNLCMLMFLKCNEKVL